MMRSLLTINEQLELVPARERTSGKLNLDANLLRVRPLLPVRAPRRQR